MVLTEFERAMLLMQAAQNEMLHLLASTLSHSTRESCEAVQAAIGKKIAMECPCVAALLNEVARG